MKKAISILIGVLLAAEVDAASFNTRFDGKRLPGSAICLSDKSFWRSTRASGSSPPFRMARIRMAVSVLSAPVSSTQRCTNATELKV